MDIATNQFIKEAKKTIIINFFFTFFLFFFFGIILQFIFLDVRFALAVALFMGAVFGYIAYSCVTEFKSKIHIVVIALLYAVLFIAFIFCLFVFVGEAHKVFFKIFHEDLPDAAVMIFAPLFFIFMDALVLLLTKILFAIPKKLKQIYRR